MSVLGNNTVSHHKNALFFGLSYECTQEFVSAALATHGGFKFDGVCNRLGYRRDSRIYRTASDHMEGFLLILLPQITIPVLLA